MSRTPGSSDPADPSAAAIAEAVRLLLARPARLGATRLVAIDGPSGSGKTTLAGPLAQAIADGIGGRVVRPRRTANAAGGREDIHGGEDAGGWEVSTRNPREAARTVLPTVAVVSTDLLATWEHPLDWWPVLDAELLTPIAGGATATMPVVAWVSGRPRPGGEIVVPPVTVLVVEGVSAGRRAVSDRLSLLVWVEIADAAARLERAVARDGESMRPYLARWQVTEAAHFAADATRERADVVMDGR